jgi:hypothetical protein
MAIEFHRLPSIKKPEFKHIFEHCLLFAFQRWKGEMELQGSMKIL